MLKDFVKDYFKSPFFFLSIILFLLTALYSDKTVNQILQSLLLDNLYLPIFIITQSTAIVLVMYPMKRGLKEYLKTQDRKTKIVFEFLITSSFIMFVPIYLIDQRVTKKNEKMREKLERLERQNQMLGLGGGFPEITLTDEDRFSMLANIVYAEGLMKRKTHTTEFNRGLFETLFDFKEKLKV